MLPSEGENRYTHPLTHSADIVVTMSRRMGLSVRGKNARKSNKMAKTRSSRRQTSSAADRTCPSPTGRLARASRDYARLLTSIDGNTRPALPELGVSTTTTRYVCISRGRGRGGGAGVRVIKQGLDATHGGGPKPVEEVTEARPTGRWRDNHGIGRGRSESATNRDISGGGREDPESISRLQL